MLVTAHGSSVDEDVTGSWVIKPLQKFDAGRLSPSARANQGHNLPGLYLEGDVLWKNWRILFGPPMFCTVEVEE